jgi:predicted transcriptional regulator
MKDNRELYNKISDVLYDKKVKKIDIAKELGISKQALSSQLKKLRDGGGINTTTIFIIEKITGEIFFAN